MQVISRQEARKNGYKYYYTAKLCKYKHDSVRHVKNGVCDQCAKEQSLNQHQNRKFDDAWKKYKSLYDRNRYIKNAENIKLKVREWERQNPIRSNKLKNDWINSNPEKRKEAVRLDNFKRHFDKLVWLKQNPQIGRYKQSIRRAAKKNATPKWADRGTLKSIYSHCPYGYHVDHIIPLQNPEVCGLHVPENLQYLPSRDNFLKGNKYDS